jgi:hypothetical protein
MIPLNELPTTDGVYVLHFSQPLAHARGYVGWAADIARRVAEHLDVDACRQARLQRWSIRPPSPFGIEIDVRRSYSREINRNVAGCSRTRARLLAPRKPSLSEHPGYTSRGRPGRG